MSLLGQIVAGESATPIGQQAVINVIQNRAAQNYGGYGTSLDAQATAYLQFSAYPNALGVPSANTETMVAAAENGTLGNVVPSALNYANPAFSTSSWVNTAVASGQGVTIGGNTFWANSSGGSPGYNPSAAFGSGSTVGSNAGDAFGNMSLGPADPSTSSSDPSSFGVGNQSDALAHTGLSSTSPTDPSTYPATSATTSITANDQMFNQPDPNKVETTNIASSGILGSEKVATATTGAGQNVETGLNTVGQQVLTSEQQAVSGLGDLFARASLVGIGLLLLAGAFVFYYMQHKTV